jgi:CheY-like chemotaxis protein
MASTPPVAIGALLVDDEPDVRLLLRNLIETENDGLFVAGEAADGNEAIDAVEACNPSVIVIDDRMPAMTGMEAAAIIIARHPGRPVVLCTAHLDDDLRKRARAVGIARCVAKGEMATIPRLLKDLAKTA